MTEHLEMAFGAAEFPPDLTGEPETFFAAFDPALDGMLGLFKAAINAELGDTWALAAKGTALASSQPVMDTLWVQPTKASLRAQHVGWPLLCLARSSARHVERTLWRDRITTTWVLDYLLGPLTGADYRRLFGALSAAEKVIKECLWNYGHPAYLDGADQFFGFDSVGLVTSVMGPASFGEDGEGVEYFGLHCEMETEELDHPLPGSLAPYTGATFVNSVGDGLDTLPDALILRTDVPLVANAQPGTASTFIQVNQSNNAIQVNTGNNAVQVDV